MSWADALASIPAGEQVLCLVLAFLWDRFAGEPPAVVHPVVWLGRLIAAFGRPRPERSSRAEFLRGLAVALVLPTVAWFGTELVLLGLADTPWLRVLVGVWLLKSTFALSALANTAGDVQRALRNEDLAGARQGLRSLCSRDPAALDESDLAAGAIESVAENASDSVVAPLFFYVLFGLPGALAYRAINTADAMIGYRGDYEWFGKAAARLDDAVNFVPARLTALLLLLSGGLTGHDVGRGISILRRDGALTESPNAGRPMATMAGLLGVRLEKKDHYALGDAERPLDPTAIGRSIRLLRTLGYVVLPIAAQGIVWLG